MYIEYQSFLDVLIMRYWPQFSLYEIDKIS